MVSSTTLYCFGVVITFAGAVTFGGAITFGGAGRHYFQKFLEESQT